MSRLFWVPVALILCAPLARADSIADEADFRFHRGAQLFRQGKVEEALGEFLASNHLVHNRNAVFNIARSFELLERHNEAYRWYTDILTEENVPAEHLQIDCFDSNSSEVRLFPQPAPPQRRSH